MSIAFHDVSYQYAPGTPWAHGALKNISFHVDNGELVGLVGHTGSGKSTLAQIATGLLKPDTGTVSVAGLILDHKSNPPRKEMIRRIGMVFQYPETQLFGETVEEDVAFGAKNRGYTPQKTAKAVREAMTLVGLDESYLKRSPYLLSGGEKRRVAIAGVLAMSPQILILDEPTAGLDASGRREFHRMLAAWQKREDAIILWISHDMTELAQVARRVLVLEDGNLLWDGALAEALRQPAVWQKAGLALPKSTELVQRLIALGYHLDDSAITPEEAAATIYRWDKEGRR